MLLGQCLNDKSDAIGMRRVSVRVSARVLRACVAEMLASWVGRCAWLAVFQECGQSGRLCALGTHLDSVATPLGRVCGGLYGVVVLELRG